MKKLFKKAFTLVELLVVIAILAVLATVSIVGYNSFTKKATVSNDNGFIAQLNAYVAAYTADGTDIKTVNEIDQELDQFDFSSIKFNPTTKGYHYGFDIKLDKFVLINDKYEVENSNSNKIDVFALVNGTTDASLMMGEGFSLYLQTASYSDGFLGNISKGVDVGNNTNISSITYKNTGSVAQDVVIRTNSTSTNLEIDDKSTGKIFHYGSAGELNIIQCHTGSYYEHGKIAFVELGIGRIVLTEDSDVEVINVTKKDANTYNNPIIADGGVLEVNMPEIISRDQVEVTDESGKTPLVQVQKTDANGNVQGTVEQVYAYANGTAGTTEKNSVQNTTIASTLGIIVLDSNGAAGEKAYGTSDKEDFKEDTIKAEIKSAKYAGGHGTPEDPYLISTIDHLYAMSEDYKYNDLVEEYCNFECYKLMADLTVENWTIGSIHYVKTSETGQMPYCNAFGGQFDGNGHTIKFVWNRNQNQVDNNGGVALFGEFIDSLGIEGYDRPGVMKNLTIDCDIDSTCDICPMFAYIWGDDCTIENCKVKGRIKGDGWFAGISLYANNYCLIKDCAVEADFTANLKQDTKWSTDYYYLSTFINQVKLNANKQQIVFDNCEVKGSITLPYCSKITLVNYGTFYAKNGYKNCIGINCVDNCIVNIAEEYTTASATLSKATLDVNP